jgi:hypothetical protein
MLPRFLLLWGAVHFLFTSPALASSVQIPGPRIMIQTAGVAFAGTVSRITGERDSATGAVLTRVLFRDLKGIKGPVSGDSIALRLAGGTFGSRRMFVPGQPEFALSKRYVILAGAGLGSRADMFIPIVAMHGGFFPVERDTSRQGEFVHDYKHRPLIRVEADRVFVADTSIDSTGQWESKAPVVVLGRKEDPKTRISEEEFLGFLSTLAERK